MLPKIRAKLSVYKTIILNRKIFCNLMISQKHSKQNIYFPLQQIRGTSQSHTIISVTLSDFILEVLIDTKFKCTYPRLSKEGQIPHLARAYCCNGQYYQTKNYKFPLQQQTPARWNDWPVDS